MPQFIKKRPLFIVILVCVLLITLMITTTNYNHILVKIEEPILYITSPIQKVFYFASNKINNLVYNVLEDKNLKTENRQLREQIEVLERELLEKNELSKQNERLKQLLNFARDSDTIEVAGARVIAKNPGNWFNIMMIDKGTKDGIDINMAVVTDRGLVGRIFQVGSNWAKVRTIVDGQSSVSGIVERTRDNGLVKGSDGMGLVEGKCRMIYLPLDSDLKPGDRVLTSGLGDIFPKGIYIGEIEEVIDEKRDFFRTAIVKPGVDFERIEEVLVITSNTN